MSDASIKDLTQDTATLDTAPESDHAVDVTAALPVNKLDAENYVADDLEGVTENLLGSGNLNFLLMQSRQTDAANVTSYGEFSSGGADPVGAEAGLFGQIPDETDTDAGDLLGAVGSNEPALNANGTDLPGLSSPTITLSPVTPLSLGDNVTEKALAFESESHHTVINNPNPPPPPPPPPTPDPDPNPDPDVDVSVHNDTDLPNIDINLDPVEDIVGDIDVITNISHDENGVNVSLDTIFADIPLVKGDILVNVPLLNPVLDGALDTLAPVSGTLNNLIDTADLEYVLQDPVGTVASVIDNLDLPGLAQDPVGAVTELTDSLGVNDLIQDPVGTVTEVIDNLQIEETLDAVTDVAENIVDNLNVDSLVQDPVGGVTDIVDGLLDVTQDDGDTDLVVTNDLDLPLVDIVLDPVESIVGDIDINLDVAHDDDGAVLGLDVLVADVDLAHTEIAPEIPLVDPGAESLLDTVSEIVDQTVSEDNLTDTAMDLLSAPETLGDNPISDLIGGADADEALWPQTDAGGIGDITGTLDGIAATVDGATALPEPIGNVTEGLGLLSSSSSDTSSSSGGGLLSGLGGGGHHGGGLFGWH